MNTMRNLLIGILVLTSASMLPAAEPAKPPATAPAKPPAAPKDDTVDWLMGQKVPEVKDTTRPASNPLVNPNKADFSGRNAVVTFSNGEQMRGALSTTLDKPVRVWVEEIAEYKDVPFNFIKGFESQVLWEREEKEWHFRESGSDIKEYSGKTYPARELIFVVNLKNGKSLKGNIASPLYLDTADGEQKVFVLHKRDKGPVGKTLKDLIYMKKIEFQD